MRNMKQVKKYFIQIAKMKQDVLKKHVADVLRGYGYDVLDGDGYTYGRGDVVLLTAHMDTVHKKPVKKIHTYVYTTDDAPYIPIDYEISSPQGIGGDDRCGVWTILDVIPRLLDAGIRPAVLFCEDEEIGGVGSSKFCNTPYIEELSALRYLIEIDRKGYNDAVFYDDGNEDFHDYVTRVTGYREEYGSFSDISHLCPACGRSGVNLSSGYYNPHTTSEYVIVSEMVHTADVIVKMVQDTVQNDVGPFEYIDLWENADDYGAFSRYGYDYGAFSQYGHGAILQSSRVTGAILQFYDTDGGYKEDVIEASSLEEAVGTFLMEHPHLSWNSVIDYDVF